MSTRIINQPVVDLTPAQGQDRAARHRKKDQYKSDFSSRFIGRGIGSTGEYARLHKLHGIPVNGGVYTGEDVVFISANGKRPGGYDPDLAEIKRAVEAGATFLTDGHKNRPEGGNTYNTGEQIVADFLRASGYVEQSELNGEVSRWHKTGMTPSYIIKEAIHKQRLNQENKLAFQWKRKSDNGFEVSSAARNLPPEKGDYRFSAFNAKLKDGRTIEQAYQLDVKGYRVDGNDWRLGKGKPPKIGIRFEQDQSAGYRERTITNASADATIAIATDFSTAGEKLTASSVKGQQKMYIPVKLTGTAVSNDTIDAIVDRLNKAKASSVNIAGNGAYTLTHYTQRQIDDVVFDLLNRVVNHSQLHMKPTLIRSGGQSGIDEAGVKAAQRLGIEALVVAPKGWMFKDKNGNTIKDEKAFRGRFEKNQDQLYHEYKSLWQQWAKENPNLMEELSLRAAGKDLTDMFANTPINQARALADILNERTVSHDKIIQVEQEGSKLTFTSDAQNRLNELKQQFDSNQIDSMELLKESYTIKINDLSKQLGKPALAEDYKELFTESELTFKQWNTLTPEQHKIKVETLSPVSEIRLNELLESYQSGKLKKEEYLQQSIHIKVQDIYTQKPIPVNPSEYPHLFTKAEIDLLRNTSGQTTSVDQSPKFQVAKNDHAVLKVVDPPDPYLPKRYQQEIERYKVVHVEEVNAYNRKSKVQKIPHFVGTKSEAQAWADGTGEIRELVERRKEVRMEIQIPLRNTDVKKLEAEFIVLNERLGLNQIKSVGTTKQEATKETNTASIGASL